MRLNGCACDPVLSGNFGSWSMLFHPLGPLAPVANTPAEISPRALKLTSSPGLISSPVSTPAEDSGTTTAIMNAHQVDRGYERIDERLRSLGARITREPGIGAAQPRMLGPVTHLQGLGDELHVHQPAAPELDVEPAGRLSAQLGTMRSCRARTP